MRRILWILTVGLLITACGSDDSGDDLLGEWQLINGEVDGQTLELVPSHPVTITFAEDAFGGTASCNGYGGVYQRANTAIILTDIAVTEMACSPSETMTLESQFLEGLARADGLLLADTLSLTGDGVRLMFQAVEPVEEAALLGTVWVLDTLIQGDAASSVSGDRATLEFFSDGSVIGSTGCRGFTGQYVVSGAEVVITDLLAGPEECPGELASQDSQVISAIEGGFRVDIDGDRMTTWTHGDEGLGYRAES